MTNKATYDGTDFYCDVAIPHPERLHVVHEDEQVLAFLHTRPFWRVHVVAVPKRHIASLTTIRAGDEPDVRALLRVVQAVAPEVEEQHGEATVLTNLGTYQVAKYLHVHVHPGGRTEQAPQ